MAKSIKLKDNVYIDSKGVDYKHTNLETTIDNIISTNNNQDTNISNLTNKINTLEQLPYFEYCQGSTRGNKSYSASAWSRPKFIYDDFVTNASSTFEKYNSTSLKVKKTGAYLIICSRETTLGTNEQDCYIRLGSYYISFTSYNASGTFITTANLNAGDTVEADVNCNSTNFIVRNVTLTIIKMSK